MFTAKNFIYSFISIIGLTVSVYLFFGLVLFSKQKEIVYQPPTSDFDTCPEFENYEKKEINGTRFYYLKQSDNVLVYFHGNASSACDGSYFAEVVDKLDYSMIFVEYAGYSNDIESPSLALLLNDVENINSFLNSNEFGTKVAVGRSLGSGLASYLTTLTSINKLLLIAPYDSTVNVAKDLYPIYPMNLLLTEKYDNVNWLREYNGEILIVHGEEDTVVPEKFSAQLFEKLRDKQIQRKTFPGIGHNNLSASNQFNQIITNFLSLSN